MASDVLVLVRTETVCMLGVVPVLTIGSCKVREALYASPDHAGVAIAEHLLYNISRSQHQSALIGYAFENKVSEEVGCIILYRSQILLFCPPCLCMRMYVRVCRFLLAYLNLN